MHFADGGKFSFARVFDWLITICLMVPFSFFLSQLLILQTACFSFESLVLLPHYPFHLWFRVTWWNWKKKYVFVEISRRLLHHVRNGIIPLEEFSYSPALLCLIVLVLINGSVYYFWIPLLHTISVFLTLLKCLRRYSVGFDFIFLLFLWKPEWWSHNVRSLRVRAV